MIRSSNAHAASTPTFSLSVVAVLALILVGLTPRVSAGQTIGSDVTYTKDIAPILQRSCQNCHRPESVAPMSLLTYQDARRFAPRIKERTQLRDRMGVMPPWFIEKDVGIQDFQNDISLTEEEIATIATWVDSGTPEGDPADLPLARVFSAEDVWDIGTPDLIVDLPAFTMEAEAPDWWGMIPPAPSRLTEDRYVAAMEVYLECIVDDEKSALRSLDDLEPEEEQQREDLMNKKYNAAVDEMERVAAQFNAEVQAYKAKDD